MGADAASSRGHDGGEGCTVTNMRKVGPSAYVYDPEPDSTEVVAGAELARLNGQIRRLTEQLADARSQIRQWEDCYYLDRAVDDMTPDELAITQAFVRKLMGEGRREHGALDLATDERDLVGEAEDELTDTVSYCLMALRKLRAIR